METEMNLEKFGEIMDKAITEADAAMLIRMPAGTQEATVQCNLGIGPVGELFFLLSAIPATMKKLNDMLEGQLDRESFANAVCELLRKDLMEE